MTGLVRAEWIKFASLRASWIKLAMAVGLNFVALGFGLAFFDNGIGAAEPDTSVAARVNAVEGGIALTSLVLVIVGVTVFTSEIRSRSIIPTMAAAPDRGDFITAKTILTLAVGLATGTFVLVVNSAVAMVVLDQMGFPLSLDDTDFVRVIFGGIAYLTISALFGLGVGIIANSSTAGIAVGLIWPIALESALQAFLPDWIARFLPFEAGAALTQVPAQGDLPPWEGGGVFLLWAAGLVLAGWWLFNRRDLGAS